jgi:hypothetical protein
VLTYVVPGEAAEASKPRWAALGTRFETFFTPDEMRAVLEEAGLVGVEHLTQKRRRARTSQAEPMALWRRKSND